MSYELLELAASSLNELLDRLAFLGGASLVLWISDPSAPSVRPTDDIDVIVELGTRIEYYRLGEALRERGFTEDSSSRVLCRWRHRNGLILDVMPTDPAILGFSNRWYPAALGAALERTLPSGTVIRAVGPPYLLATKIEAFRRRGRGDYLGSIDFGDIVTLLDGREEIVEEVRASPAELRQYLADQFTAMRSNRFFESSIAAALLPDAASQGRRPIVLERVEAIVVAAPA